MRFNIPTGTNLPPVSFNSQTPYIPFNLGALSAMSNQQLEVSCEVFCLELKAISSALLLRVSYAGISHSPKDYL